MLCDGVDKNGIADRLCAEFGIDRTEALRDVEDFMEQLERCCAEG